MSFLSARPGAWKAAGVLVSLFVGASSGALGTCGPFTDVAADAFCPFVLELLTLGITTGTTPTTYDPEGNVTRLQMAAFLSRSAESLLSRSSRRAALKQFWTSRSLVRFASTTGGSPFFVESDGTDLWVANGAGTVTRHRASDMEQLGTWTGASAAVGVLVAADSIFVTGKTSPGKLYEISPAFGPTAVTTVASNLGNNPLQAAFDGASIWTANAGPPGSLSIWNGSGTTTVTAGFSGPNGILFDGAHMWVTDAGPGTLLKVDSSGSILQTTTVGQAPAYPVFDGTNIWVPNSLSNSLSVVRASTGAVLATLTGNGLAVPKTAAFDGQRVLVTNVSGNSVSLWKASDLTQIGTVPVSVAAPYGACSDGINFWIVGNGDGFLQRF